MIIPYLRTQTELLSDVRARMRDPNGARWSNAEVYMVMNEALLSWASRVSIPHLYTLSDGWVDGHSDYYLPPYIRGSIDPQQRYYNGLYPVQEDFTDTWTDIQAFTVEPNGSGGQTLRLDFVPRANEARIIWWMPNSQLPTTLPTLATSINADDDDLALVGDIADIEDAGYIRIGTEWLHYAGVQREGTNTILNNLLRGLQSTTAVAHLSGATVAWGVGVHRTDLYGQLYDTVRGLLHGLFLTNAAESERAHHERMALYYEQRAKEYWRGYVPQRKPKMRLGRSGVGMVGQTQERIMTNTGQPPAPESYSLDFSLEQSSMYLGLSSL